MGGVNGLNLIVLVVVGLVVYGSLGARAFVAAVNLLIVGLAIVCAFAACPAVCAFISSNLLSDAGLARVAGFWLVFAAVLLGLWSLVDAVVPTPPRLWPGLDKALGGLIGAGTGALVASILVLTLSIVPGVRNARWVAQPLAGGRVLFGVERAAPALLARYLRPQEDEPFEFLAFWTEGVEFREGSAPRRESWFERAVR